MSEKFYFSVGENVDELDVVWVVFNGFGCIGWNIFCVVFDNLKVELVVINDVMDFDDMVYFVKYDFVMGWFDGVE